RRALASLEHPRHLSGLLAEGGGADGVGLALALVARPPAVIAALEQVHQPAADEARLAASVVVEVEEVAGQVESDVAVGAAAAAGVAGQLRAGGLAAEDRPGAQDGGAAAVRALDVVVAVAAGDVQPAIGADRQAADLMLADAGEALRDDLHLVIGAADLRLL